MDFNVEGKKIVTIDENGVLLVSDVELDKYLFHAQTKAGEKTCN